MTGLFVPLLVAAGLALALGNRGSPRALGGLLSVAPAASLVVLFSLPDGARAAVPWVPGWQVVFGFFLDGLGRLFAALVLGIGALVVLYAGFYFDGEKATGRFFALLLAFMAAMVGLVTAGDLMSLFVCWEATSLLSFLLVGYHREDANTRRAALRALIVTGGGGIALLLGFVGLGTIAGTWDLKTLLAAGPALKAHSAYPVLFGLIALGAFTKSAQVPFHRWLPGAMAAPTPASAYLHSATMVKAGIFLLMRLHPALGGTDLWFWTLSAAGLATMLGGAWRGLGETDLKALLAQSTLSTLGALTLLAGQDTPAAFKALTIGIVAHALYKSSLFMIAGVVDHATGTRDLRRLGGLKHALAGPAVVGFFAALSLAGFPPMMGFLAKETLFATVSHPGLPGFVSPLLSAGAVLAAALLIAQAARFYLGVFEGPERTVPHAVPGLFWGAAAAPAALSTLLALVPDPRFLTNFFAESAAAAYGSPVKVSLALWSGWNAPLALSALAVGAGIGLALADRRGALGGWAQRFRWGDRLEAALGVAFRRGTDGATALQAGRGRFYLAVVLAAAAALVMAALASPGGHPIALPRLEWAGWFRTEALAVVIAAALVTPFVNGRAGVLALGVAGLGVAAVLAVEPAPDVALVQILADVFLVLLLLAALPSLKSSGARPTIGAPAVLGLLWGVGSAVLAGWALAGRPRASAIATYVAEHAKPLAGSRDFVGAIVVEFRGLDTWIEIAVFAAAALAAGAVLAGSPRVPRRAASPLMTVLARAFVPLALLLSFVHVAFGHNRPGDGFSAALIAIIALGLYNFTIGPGAVQKDFRWIKPDALVAIGLGTVLLRAVGPVLIGRPAFAPFELWSRDGFSISGGLLFEAGIFLTVLGGAARLIDALEAP